MNIIQRQETFIDGSTIGKLGLAYQYIFLLATGEKRLSFDGSCRYYPLKQQFEQGVDECICTGAKQILGEFHDV